MRTDLFWVDDYADGLLPLSAAAPPRRPHPQLKSFQTLPAPLLLALPVGV